MCGLFGVANFSNDCLVRSKRALATLNHRGPDQTGVWSSAHVFMGHQRLSILDLSEFGRQPMVSSDSSVVISVNGEIYNYEGLRDSLQKLGYTFKSKSDSEVVLHGYREWGIEKLLEYIDGMYAISIYDAKRNAVFLARDRAGIKPMYYSSIGGVLTWASELKAIRSFYGSGLEIDRTAIYDYLTYLYVPCPKTLYKNVHKLAPANYLKYDLAANSIEIKKYWSLPTVDKSIEADAATEMLKELLSASVKEQMVSDVPVGFFLSGGIDSSVVVAAAVSAGFNPHTYTIGFEEKEKDESLYAQLVSDHFGTKHKTKTIDLLKSKELMARLAEWYDEPFADTSALPSFLVSQHARSDVTVVLTGDGGDELFGGYTRYQAFAKIRDGRVKIPRVLTRLLERLSESGKPDILPRVADKLLRHFGYDDLELYTKLMGGMTKFQKRKYAKELGIPDSYDDYWYFRQFYDQKLSVLNRLQRLDFQTYLHDDILTKVDRVSMSVSLECRVPFLQRQLIEFAFSVPEDVLYLNGELKGLLKHAFTGNLPKEILERGKFGFSIPVSKWRDSLLNGMKFKQEAILKSCFSELISEG